MSTIPVSDLFVPEDAAAILAKGLQIAVAQNLPVTTWSDGDPTITDFYFISELLEALELIIEQLVAAGFLGSSTGKWLRVKLYQDFGVTVPEATRGLCLATLTNAGGGQYTIAPGDVTAKNTTTGKTFRNTTSGTLFGVGATIVGMEFVADEPGSASNTAVGELDALVTVFRGVSITNTTAAVAIDQPTEDQQRALGRAKLGALSPNGPRDAYFYVATNPELTGTTGITDARAFGDSDTGQVVTYLRGPSGAVSTPDRDAAHAAILKWTVPLCITPTTLSATNKVVNIAYSLWLYAADAREVEEIEAAVEAALLAMFLSRPIGGDIIPPATTGALYRSLIEATIRSVSTRTFRVEVTEPATEATATSRNEVLVPGTITATAVVKVPNP